MICENCQKPQSGLYRIQNLCCRIRLIVSARPSLERQEMMLAFIERRLGRSAREETENALRDTHARSETSELLAPLPEPCTPSGTAASGMRAEDSRQSGMLDFGQ